MPNGHLGKVRYAKQNRTRVDDVPIIAIHLNGLVLTLERLPISKLGEGYDDLGYLKVRLRQQRAWPVPEQL